MKVRLGQSLVVPSLLACTAMAVAAQEPPSADGPFAGGRIGVCLFPDFKSASALGPREIEGDRLFEVGLDAGWSLDSWVVRGSVALAGLGGDLSVTTETLAFGRRFPLPFDGATHPAFAEVAGGVIMGQLEADTAGFGSFDGGLGFLLRCSAELEVKPNASVSLWLEYRQLEFDFPDATSGDSSAGGGMIALGVGGGINF